MPGRAAPRSRASRSTRAAATIPPNYQGALLFSDYSRLCMWVIFPDAGGDPDPVDGRGVRLRRPRAPSTSQLGPDGNLYYVDFDGGNVLRIEYGLHAVATADVRRPARSADRPVRRLRVARPRSRATPSRTRGTSTATGSSTTRRCRSRRSSTPSSAPTSVRLKVTDQRGGSDISAPITITVGGGDPTATILTPPPTLTWKVGDPIAFSGQGTDPQDGTLPPSALSWQVIIHHCPSNCHTHLYQTFDGVASGSFPAPDHEYPSYLEIQLTATDSDGNTGTASVNLNPLTVEPLDDLGAGRACSCRREPSPLVAPFTQTVHRRLPDRGHRRRDPGHLPDDLGVRRAGPTAAPRATPSRRPRRRATLHRDLRHARGSLDRDGRPAPAGCAGAPITYTLTVANAGLSQAVNRDASTTRCPRAPRSCRRPATAGAAAERRRVLCTRPTLDVATAPPITIIVTAPAGTALTTPRPSARRPPTSTAATTPPPPP